MGYDHLEKHEHVKYDPENSWNSEDSIIEVWKSEIKDLKVEYFVYGGVFGGLFIAIIMGLNWYLTKL